ncbi:MAG TPA: hypothetical protein VFI24_14440 [Pyrinomonadaceae bacterium]|nr:hypothetical protein [Pyrinomonadaceae bacterium]
MYRKQVAFQLEKTVPGTFLMQGLLGGALGGFVASVVAALAWKENTFVMALDVAALAIFTGGIIGIIKAALMRGVAWVSGIQYRAITRVAITTILTGVGIAVAGLQVKFDDGFLQGCLIWSLSVGIPVALLVGSRVKPWELFTFGSVAAGEVDHRSGSRSILATLGTLPLRFMSIAASALLALYGAHKFTAPYITNRLLAAILFVIVVGFYPLYSAYVTFRSPRKIVLAVIGVIINIPITFYWLFLFRWYLELGSDQDLGQVLAISGSFILAWMIFLTARLAAKLTSAPSLSISSNKSIAVAPNLDHQCLGSRFAEWQQHAA